MGNCSDVYECGYCAEGEHHQGTDYCTTMFRVAGETNCMFDDICDYPGDPLVRPVLLSTWFV
jgi:hypothetical protein